MAEPSMRSAWIRRFHPAPEAAVRLVCFPHAGGAATYYHPLSQAMSPHADVLAIQYPGRQDRLAEPCIEDIPTLADRLVAELTPWTDRPLLLFGHSMGAAVAFEVALRLERRGVLPLGLFASGLRAPSLRRDRRMHLATDAELIAELKNLNAANATVLADETLLGMVLPALRGDYRAIDRYHNPSALPLRCPIVALTGDADPVADTADVELWARHTSASFRMRIFPGGHFFLDDHAEAVRREIREHIRVVSAR
ncbi:alpha/beta fold hydrolase [Streptomyces cinerochromogenes]